MRNRSTHLPFIVKIRYVHHLTILIRIHKLIQVIISITQSNPFTWFPDIVDVEIRHSWSCDTRSRHLTNKHAYYRYSHDLNILANLKQKLTHQLSSYAYQFIFVSESRITCVLIKTVHPSIPYEKTSWHYCWILYMV